jgi:hypothetical protein
MKSEDRSFCEDHDYPKVYFLIHVLYTCTPAAEDEVASRGGSRGVRAATHASDKAKAVPVPKGNSVPSAPENTILLEKPPLPPAAEDEIASRGGSRDVRAATHASEKAKAVPVPEGNSVSSAPEKPILLEKTEGTKPSANSVLHSNVNAGQATRLFAARHGKTTRIYLSNLSKERSNGGRLP